MPGCSRKAARSGPKSSPFHSIASSSIVGSARFTTARAFPGKPNSFSVASAASRDGLPSDRSNGSSVSSSSSTSSSHQDFFPRRRRSLFKCIAIFCDPVAEVSRASRTLSPETSSESNLGVPFRPRLFQNLSPEITSGFPPSSRETTAIVYEPIFLFPAWTAMRPDASVTSEPSVADTLARSIVPLESRMRPPSRSRASECCRLTRPAPPRSTRACPCPMPSGPGSSASIRRGPTRSTREKYSESLPTTARGSSLIGTMSQRLPPSLIPASNRRVP
ncbi:MAG: hypothetical protein BWY66_01331 [bacterium ADurb.Bin374]|nr:MAG: hypothetical protein BWY66_01331 [bacterium ADurb.Bin374]